MAFVLRFLVFNSLLIFAVNGYMIIKPSENKYWIPLSYVGDPGQPLFLTPYIEEGKLEEARNLSRVNFPGFPKLKSYSGFFTVNKTYDSNQFLWYFPAKTYLKEQVVILWLQGGPGGSSLYGLFNENGPIQAENGMFKARETHWATFFHVIYIDNPVGAGFSFTNDTRGYCTDQTQIGEQLYTTLIQFFQLFPELQPFKFIIAGESYAGKYIPALAYTIHRKNPSAKLKINLQGMAIGNGLCDPINQLNYGEYLYKIGLIDWDRLEDIEKLQNETVELIKKEQWKAAYDGIHDLYFNIAKSIGNISMYNFLNQDTRDSLYVPLLHNDSIRRSIHVGNLDFDEISEIVHDHLEEDFPKSVAPWISELLNHYSVLFYNGQLDITVAYTLTIDFLRNLKFSSSEEYKTADRIRLMLIILNTNRVDQMGYMKRAGNLTEIMIRNAGHMVPRDQPEWALEMLKFWIISMKSP